MSIFRGTSVRDFDDAKIDPSSFRIPQFASRNSDFLTHPVFNTYHSETECEDYAPVGYYGDFQIRGFPIDLARRADKRTDDRRRAGRPAENKQRVEIVKGIAGLKAESHQRVA